MTTRTCPNHSDEGRAPGLDGLANGYTLLGPQPKPGLDGAPKPFSPDGQMPLRVWRCRECGYLQLQDASLPE